MEAQKPSKALERAMWNSITFQLNLFKIARGFERSILSVHLLTNVNLILLILHRIFKAMAKTDNCFL